MSTKTRRQIIETTIDDLVSNFLYYDRKEDEDLPRGEIEAAVAAGEITKDEIVERFRKELEKGL
jgi:Ca2+-binding EF-hand superfamily protein